MAVAHAHQHCFTRRVIGSAQLSAKLCDFGLSQQQTGSRTRLAGTKGHIAPELFEIIADPYDGSSEMIYTFACDVCRRVHWWLQERLKNIAPQVYSYGVFLHELFTGHDAEAVDYDTNQEIDAILVDQVRPTIDEQLAKKPCVDQCSQLQKKKKSHTLFSPVMSI